MNVRRSLTLLIAAVFLLGVAALPTQTLAEPLPIIFVHGNGDDAAKWVGIIWLFESNGYPSDKLYSIRFSLPAARTDDTREEPFRSSTVDATSELSAFVTRVLLESHARKVVLVGSSRGGMTIRNYIQNGGGRNNVAIAILAGTPNHGVNASSNNLNGEFNGLGPYLQGLNHADGDGNEVVSGVRFLTLRSDKLDKYAQPTGIGLGLPQVKTGVTFEGPALKGASNHVLQNFDHRELAFRPEAFDEMYTFIVGEKPKTLKVAAVAAPKISGLVTGYQGMAPTNLPLSEVRLRIFVITKEIKSASSTPVYETVTKQDGRWGPVEIRPDKEYEFDLECEGRHVRYYKAALPRSSSLINLRFSPVPKMLDSVDANHEDRNAAGKILIARPQGYFSSERDPVIINGKSVPEEPSGLPLRDSFIAAVASNDTVAVSLREETILVEPSRDLSKVLPIVDFQW